MLFGQLGKGVAVRLLRIAFVGIVGAMVVVPVPSWVAWAIPTDPGGETPCTSKVTLSMTLSEALIDLGDPEKLTTTLSWDLQASPGCQPTWIRLYYRDETTRVLLNTGFCRKFSLEGCSAMLFP